MRIGDTLKKARDLFVEVDDDSAATLNDKPWNVMDATEPEKPATGPVTASPAVSLPKTTKTVDQIVRESPGPNLDDIKPAATPQQPVISQDGRVNFPAIYGLANLPTSPFTAEQVLEVLNSLPAELPLESKRATLKVTLDAMGKALGVTPESIVADASRKLAALSAYAHSYSDQAGQYMEKCKQEIARLEGEIEARKKGIEDATSKQATMTESCTAESDRLHEVLQFFSVSIPPSS
jgi:hypothetical protein